MGGLTPDELTGGNRTRQPVELRFAVMLVLSERGWSYSQIGRLLGGRDHSSVSHGLARGRGLLADPDFAWVVAALEVECQTLGETLRGEVPAAVLARFVQPQQPPALDPEELELARFGAMIACGSRRLAAALAGYANS